MSAFLLRQHDMLGEPRESVLGFYGGSFLREADRANQIKHLAAVTACSG